jgi:hypothetical protein
MGKMITQTATMTVDGNSDGFLSQANDVAQVDVRNLTKLSVYINHVQDTVPLVGHLHAALDLATKTTHCNTVIEEAAAGTGGNSTTIAFVAGDSINAGHLDESGYPAIVFHFKTAVTTVANFETAIAASVHLAVRTPGTGANVLAVTVDEFTATNLAGGTSSEGTFSMLVEKSVDGVNFATHTTVTQTDFGDGNSTAKEVTFSDSNGMPLSVQTVKVTLTAVEDTNEFSVTAVGELRTS